MYQNLNQHRSFVAGELVACQSLVRQAHKKLGLAVLEGKPTEALHQEILDLERKQCETQAALDMIETFWERKAVDRAPPTPDFKALKAAYDKVRVTFSADVDAGKLTHEAKLKAAANPLQVARASHSNECQRDAADKIKAAHLDLNAVKRMLDGLAA